MFLTASLALTATLSLFIIPMLVRLIRSPVPMEKFAATKRQILALVLALYLEILLLVVLTISALLRSQ